MKTYAIALLIASSFSMSATPAQAFFNDDVVFRYKAAELATSDGRAALLKRMKGEVRAACRAGSLFFMSDDACQVDVEKQLVAAINDSLLLALHQGRTPKVAMSDL